MHFGIVSPPVAGHLNPFGALGRELIARGHRVTLLHMEDVRSRATDEELEFLPLGISDHPPGSLPVSLARLGQLDGFAALKFTIAAIRKTSEMFCRDLPSVVRAAGIEALLVDQTEPAGGSIAEHLQIPFVTICNALNMNEEPGVPPPFTAWSYGTSVWSKCRNIVGYQAARFVMNPVYQVIAAYREKWQLPAHRNPRQTFSALAQLSQLPAAFDYPRKALPPNFFYVGPLRRVRNTVSFPWDRLDGRPLVYASLGTLQNGRERVFHVFAEACASLNVQLVIAGFEGPSTDDFPGLPIVVKFAPQLEVLKHAMLTITHGGLNTVLDSLSCGVPMVVMPINYEQPAIAERVRWAGLGEVVPFASLSATRLREVVQTVLEQKSYRNRAYSMAQSITEAGGVRRCADLVETALLG
jgi:zeaxanthin glucosyltransferase